MFKIKNKIKINYGHSESHRVKIPIPEKRNGGISRKDHRAKTKPNLARKTSNPPDQCPVSGTSNGIMSVPKGSGILAPPTLPQITDIYCILG